MSTWVLLISLLSLAPADTLWIPFGTAPDALGLLERGPDAGPPRGPTSFFVEGDSLIYILDVVKGRVAVYDRSGRFRRFFPVPRTYLWSHVAALNGTPYVLAYTGAFRPPLVLLNTARAEEEPVPVLSGVAVSRSPLGLWAGHGQLWVLFYVDTALMRRLPETELVSFYEEGPFCAPVILGGTPIAPKAQVQSIRKGIPSHAIRGMKLEELERDLGNGRVGSLLGDDRMGRRYYLAYRGDTLQVYRAVGETVEKVAETRLTSYAPLEEEAVRVTPSGTVYIYDSTPQGVKVEIWSPGS